VEEVLDEASDAGILAGYPIGRDYPELADCLLIAVTEKRTREDIDTLVDLLFAKRARAPKAAVAQTS
jgi:glycine dehydrogenase subunit 1